MVYSMAVNHFTSVPGRGHTRSVLRSHQMFCRLDSRDKLLKGMYPERQASVSSMHREGARLCSRLKFQQITFAVHLDIEIYLVPYSPCVHSLRRDLLDFVPPTNSDVEPVQMPLPR